MAKPPKDNPLTPTTKQMEDADEKIGIVQIISGKTGKGEDFYAYLSIKPSRFEEFCLLAQAGDAMDIEEYGEILKKGFGKEPSPQVMREMEEKYGVDHNFIENLQKKAVK